MHFYYNENRCAKKIAKKIMTHHDFEESLLKASLLGLQFFPSSSRVRVTSSFRIELILGSYRVLFYEPSRFSSFELYIQFESSSSIKIENRIKLGSRLNLRVLLEFRKHFELLDGTLLFIDKHLIGEILYLTTTRKS